MMTLDSAVDVGIITIAPVEVEALFAAFGIKRDSYEAAGGPLRYWRTSYRSASSGRSLSVVVSILGGEVGNTEAAIATAQFLRDWYPKLMCLVGIAAGIRGKIQIANVVIPNKVHDRTIKVFEDRTFRARGRTYIRSDFLNRMLKVSPLAGDAFLAELHRFAQEDISRAVETAKDKGLYPDQFGGNPQVVDGSLASDDVLIKDPAYLEGILEATDEQCRGGEMEAAGFVLACQGERIDFPWLVFRGISDFGDSTKDDSFQLLAAKAACAALKLFIEKSLVIDALPPNPRALRSTSTLEFNLVRYVRDAFTAERWKEVCRIGMALSRPLWLSGHAAIRYEIGRLVENAAAFSNNLSLRARTLIDDLGWTAIKLERCQLGEKNIHDGIRLAIECDDHYVVAKGHRHLASLYRQRGDLGKVASFLAKAQEAAERIADFEERREIISSLKVSTAKLHMVRGEYSKAISLLYNALQTFRDAGDTERGIKVYSQLARCKENLGDLQEAERLYLTGRTMALDAGRFDEFAENTRGLIAIVSRDDPSRSKALAREVYEFALSRGLWDEARTWNEEYRISDPITKFEEEDPHE